MIHLAQILFSISQACLLNVVSLIQSFLNPCNLWQDRSKILHLKFSHVKIIFNIHCFSYNSIYDLYSYLTELTNVIRFLNFTKSLSFVMCCAFHSHCKKLISFLNILLRHIIQIRTCHIIVKLYLVTLNVQYFARFYLWSNSWQI